MSPKNTFQNFKSNLLKDKYILKFKKNPVSDGGQSSQAQEELRFLLMINEATLVLVFIMVMAMVLVTFMVMFIIIEVAISEKENLLGSVGSPGMIMVMVMVIVMVLVMVMVIFMVLLIIIEEAPSKKENSRGSVESEAPGVE